MTYISFLKLLSSSRMKWSAARNGCSGAVAWLVDGSLALFDIGHLFFAQNTAGFASQIAGIGTVFFIYTDAAFTCKAIFGGA